MNTFEDTLDLDDRSFIYFENEIRSPKTSMDRLCYELSLDGYVSEGEFCWDTGFGINYCNSVELRSVGFPSMPIDLDSSYFAFSGRKPFSTFQKTS